MRRDSAAAQYPVVSSGRYVTKISGEEVLFILNYTGSHNKFNLMLLLPYSKTGYYSLGWFQGRRAAAGSLPRFGGLLSTKVPQNLHVSVS